MNEGAVLHHAEDLEEKVEWYTPEGEFVFLGSIYYLIRNLLNNLFNNIRN